MDTKKYWAYWKRGWWAWLMQLCANLGSIIVIIPLAFIFANNKMAYWSSALFVFLVIGAPFQGWLFERFAKASPRLDNAANDNSKSV